MPNSTELKTLTLSDGNYNNTLPIADNTARTLITGLQNDLAGKADISDIPTATSDLTNDSGFLTAHQDISGKQDKLVSGNNIKTINGMSLLGSGNLSISGASGGEANVIETVKVNGVALTPDSNKAVDVTVPTVTSDLTNDSGFVDESVLQYGQGQVTDISNASVTVALRSRRYRIYNVLSVTGANQNISIDSAFLGESFVLIYNQTSASFVVTIVDFTYGGNQLHTTFVPATIEVEAGSAVVLEVETFKALEGQSEYTFGVITLSAPLCEV